MSIPADPEASRNALTAKLLERDLALMRKAAGFTPLRLGKSKVLPHLLGGDHEPFEAMRERFVSAITSLRDPEPALLLAVFGLTQETDSVSTLDERRLIYGGSIGRSVYTVANSEASALEHLRSQLITGWYPKSPLRIRIPATHNGIVQEGRLALQPSSATAFGMRRGSTIDSSPRSMRRNT